MHLYCNILGLSIPSYGICIALGIIITNIIAVIIIKKEELCLEDFIIVEAYALLGGFIGSKLLYIIINLSYIDWGRLSDFNYFNSIMLGGFVFYGGLIGGLIFIFLASLLHKIDVMLYIDKFIFLLPLAHAFGRLGCFMAGCCYGIPYDGPLHVIFPKNSMALPDTPLFPVQLFEAVLLVFLAFILFILTKRNKNHIAIAFYLIGYGIIRIITEHFRYDNARGVILGISTSQFISIVIIVSALLYLFICILFHRRTAPTRP